MLDGDLVDTAFTTAQLAELERTLMRTGELTGAHFSAYVGKLPRAAIPLFRFTGSSKTQTCPYSWQLTLNRGLLRLSPVAWSAITSMTSPAVWRA